jgi:hypothetical protein
MLHRRRISSFLPDLLADSSVLVEGPHHQREVKLSPSYVGDEGSRLKSKRCQENRGRVSSCLVRRVIASSAIEKGGLGRLREILIFAGFA